MIKSHFHHLPQVLIEAIKLAKKELKIAVCWFTLPEIFEELLRKAESGITVEIIINFDQLNFQASGLPFGKIIDSGGKVLAYVGHGLLHHKFLIVDNQIVINGSFNWTRSNHHDSLLEIHDEKTAQHFETEWLSLLPFSKNLTELDKSQAKKVSITHLFQPSFWQHQDLRRNLLKGANVWTVQMSVKPFGKNQKYPSWSRCMSQQVWYLPACKNVTDQVVALQGVFHENIFQTIENENIIKIKNFNIAKIFCKKCTIGDITLTLENHNIVAIGVVMSEPLYDEVLGLHCAVEWQLLASPTAITFKVSPSPIARILNGGLAILAQCFTK